MLLIVAAVVVAVAGVAYLITAEDRPRYFRRKRVAFLGDLARALATDRAEGSTVVMSSPEKPDLIEVVKGQSGDELNQEVVFRIPTSRLTPKERDAVVSVLGGAAPEVWDDSTGASYLSARVQGSPAEIGARALEVAEAVEGALGQGGLSQWTFVVRAPFDIETWRTTNSGLLQDLSKGSRVARWLAGRLRGRSSTQ